MLCYVGAVSRGHSEWPSIKPGKIYKTIQLVVCGQVTIPRSPSDLQWSAEAGLCNKLFEIIEKTSRRPAGGMEEALRCFNLDLVLQVLCNFSMVSQQILDPLFYKSKCLKYMVTLPEAIKLALCQ